MKKIVTLSVGALFLTAMLGVSPGWSAEKKAAATTPAAAKTKETLPAKVEAPKATEKKELLDINSASVDDLKSLTGVGDAYAKKIVENRPYKRKDDLVKKKIIPQATYEGVKEQIIAHQAKTADTKPPDLKSAGSMAKDASTSKAKK